jgi:hypothetical protein
MKEKNNPRDLGAGCSSRRVRSAQHGFGHALQVPPKGRSFISAISASGGLERTSSRCELGAREIDDEQRYRR